MADTPADSRGWGVSFNSKIKLNEICIKTKLMNKEIYLNSQRSSKKLGLRTKENFFESEIRGVNEPSRAEL